MQDTPDKSQQRYLGVKENIKLILELIFGNILEHIFEYILAQNH